MFINISLTKSYGQKWQDPCEKHLRTFINVLPWASFRSSRFPFRRTSKVKEAKTEFRASISKLKEAETEFRLLISKLKEAERTSWTSILKKLINKPDFHIEVKRSRLTSWTSISKPINKLDFHIEVKGSRLTSRTSILKVKKAENENTALWTLPGQNFKGFSTSKFLKWIKDK
ncbi:unnamed protein product [Rhizophagus irregularis]|nr:unnamed protein product [Rhizophagus irregularis]